MDGVKSRIPTGTTRYPSSLATTTPLLLYISPYETIPEFLLHSILIIEKRLREEEDERNGVKKNQPRKRKKKNKKSDLPDGESVPGTPAEAAKEMARQRAFSKKIDYSAMDRLFADD